MTATRPTLLAAHRVAVAELYRRNPGTFPHTAARHVLNGAPVEQGALREFIADIEAEFRLDLADAAFLAASRAAKAKQDEGARLARQESSA